MLLLCLSLWRKKQEELRGGVCHTKGHHLTTMLKLKVNGREVPGFRVENLVHRLLSLRICYYKIYKNYSRIS